MNSPGTSQNSRGARMPYSSVVNQHVCTCWTRNSIMMYSNKKKHTHTDRTSRRTQAGIGHSAPAHRGGHVQNKSRRREQRRGRQRTRP